MALATARDSKRLGRCSADTSKEPPLPLTSSRGGTRTHDPGIMSAVL
jgi:hypothetical protein